MDVQEEADERLIASVEDMRKGIGLDVEALIQMLAFKDIQLYC